MAVSTAEATTTSAEGDSPLLRIEGLHVRFGRQTVLRDIHLNIRRGETVTRSSVRAAAERRSC